MTLIEANILLTATKWPQDIGRMSKKTNKDKSGKETSMNLTFPHVWPCRMINWEHLLCVQTSDILILNHCCITTDIKEVEHASSHLTIISGLTSLIQCIAALKWYFCAPALTGHASCHLECLCLHQWKNGLSPPEHLSRFLFWS